MYEIVLNLKRSGDVTCCDFYVLCDIIYEIMLMNDIIYDKLLDIMRGDFIYDLYDITPPPHLR